MKKYFIIPLLLLCSCSMSQNRTAFGHPEKSAGQEIYEEVMEQVEERVLTDKWMEKRIEKHWFEGHEYLVVVPVGRYVTGCDVLAITHNPNCPCTTKEVEIIE